MNRRIKRTAAKQDVAALANMSLRELRNFWEARYGLPPAHRLPDMLRRVLAWRIQADAFGGLDAVTIKLLDSNRLPLAAADQAGTRLARDYAGQRHEVVIAEDGVMYVGQLYKSLSEVARLITGQRWNGPRFFGLRQANVR